MHPHKINPNKLVQNSKCNHAGPTHVISGNHRVFEGRRPLPPSSLSGAGGDLIARMQMKDVLKTPRCYGGGCVLAPATVSSLRFISPSGARVQFEVKRTPTPPIFLVPLFISPPAAFTHPPSYVFFDNNQLQAQECRVEMCGLEHVGFFFISDSTLIWQEQHGWGYCKNNPSALPSHIFGACGKLTAVAVSSGINPPPAI